MLAALFGLSAFSLYGLRGSDRGDALALRPWLVAGAVLGLLLSICWLVLMASAMAGTPPWPIDHAAIGGLLTGSAVGVAWQFRIVVLVIAALAATTTSGRGSWTALVALSSAIALAMLAWTGHGAMDDGTIGWVHLVANILHLLAAGVWVGALLGLILLVARPASRVDAAYLGLTHRALHGFGTVGTIVVVAIVVTGLVQSWLLVGIGNAASLAATLYGRLLLIKLTLFAAMLGLATLNRFQLTPALERSSSIAAADHHGALAGLRRSLVIEAACVITILSLVAWLGTLAPPASAV